MGQKLSYSKKKQTCLTISMAEAKDVAVCQCIENSSSSNTACVYCQPSTSSQSCESSSASALSASDGAFSKRTFRNLTLGCRKQPKSKDKAERSGKSKLNWTLRWRLKSPQVIESREPMIDLNRFNPAEYPIEDKDEAARRARAREIDEGIEMGIESLPQSYHNHGDSHDNVVLQNEASSLECTPPVVVTTVTNESLPLTEDGNSDHVQETNISASTIIEGLTVLLHRSLAISMDSQRAWNVLTHSDLHFLVQHFHWHQHQHGPQVLV